MSEVEYTRVMALHALAYCERLYYLEEVEEIKVADDRVFAGRALHEDLKRAEEDASGWTSMEMSSATLGLVGKVDAMRRREGSSIPYEHKRGRCRRVGKKATAWNTDELQVCAYGMLMEEASGERVEEGRVRYHADNVTVRVPLDDRAREAVREAVSRARKIRSSLERPPVTENENLCVHCSLAPICLPEEERLVDDHEWDAIRLFPADRDAETVHVVGRGARVSKSGETLKVVDKDKDVEDRVFPIREVGALVVHGYAQVTTQALLSCASRGIPVHWLTAGGRYATGLAGLGPVQRRIRQYKALCDDTVRLGLTRSLTTNKVETQLKYLLRASRKAGERPPELDERANEIRAALRGIGRAENADSIRGYEGTAGRSYFGALPLLLREGVPEEMKPNGRSRRPPRDRFNALLGFGYALLYQNVLQAVLAVGLEPAVGFFHTPRSSAHPLVLDLMELFRVPVWDMPVIGSVNRGQWNADEDFQVTVGRVWLSAEGRKKAIGLFENRLTDTWKHPVVGYSLSYARLIELEVRLLEKEWTGKPGLFARMRLR